MRQAQTRESVKSEPIFHTTNVARLQYIFRGFGNGNHAFLMRKEMCTIDFQKNI